LTPAGGVAMLRRVRTSINMARSQREPVTSLLHDEPVFTRLGGGAFLVLDGPDRGERMPLGPGPMVFGSSPSCGFTLTDNTVSRRHLSATREPHGVVLRDLGSTNGAFVHGSRFKEIVIGYGAAFTVGRTTIKFVPEEEVVEPKLSDADHFGEIKGQDPKMRRLFALLTDIAPTDATVIIEGETGTGKELVAEEIPILGIRTDLPFKEAKGQLVETFEREYVEDLIRRHRFNLSSAAREAQIDRKHLRELLRKYGLHRDGPHLPRARRETP